MMKAVLSRRLVTAFAWLTLATGVPAEDLADTPRGAPATRGKELGLLAYRKYPQYYRPIKEKMAVRFLTPFCPTLEIIPQDADIFLPENVDAIRQYKRIWIPGYAATFTPAMYEGMRRYIAEGGLLISNETMCGIDTNGDFRFDVRTNDQLFGREKHNPALGVFGGDAANYREMKIVRPSPMTEGLPENQRLSFKTPLGGRWVTNDSGATVVIVAKGSSKRRDNSAVEMEGPVLTYRQEGKGAAIFLAIAGGDEALDKIVVNVLSPKTLRWLCEQ